MPVLVLPKGSIMRWSGNDITEHNRGELRVSTEVFSNESRMADATYRAFVVGKKRTWTVSWSMVPNVSARTVDGKWGGDDMEAFWNANYDNTFVLTIKPGVGAEETYTVVFKEFTKSVVKRGDLYDFWEISVTLEEV